MCVCVCVCVTLAFCSIQRRLIIDFVPNLVSLTSPSLDILGKTQTGADFRISGQSLIKENCHNSRTSGDKTWTLQEKQNKNKKI